NDGEPSEPGPQRTNHIRHAAQSLGNESAGQPLAQSFAHNEKQQRDRRSSQEPKPSYVAKNHVCLLRSAFCILLTPAPSARTFRRRGGRGKGERERRRAELRKAHRSFRFSVRSVAFSPARRCA